MSKLKLDLRVGESVSFDGNRIKVTLQEKSGQRARLEIVADEDVKISTQRNSVASTIAKNGVTIKLQS